MEYRLAKPEDAKEIYGIVQDTIKRVYPKYYLPEIVDMFCEFHNKENIGEDIENGNVYVLLENSKIIGTGTIKENHITRVYVSPDFQGKGFGTFIMNQLEEEIGKRYDKAEIDASLPACKLYYNRGFKTIDHGIWECADGVIQVYEIMEKQLKKISDGCSNLRLRPYKTCDAKTIVTWIHDEISFRKWSSDRYESFPITEEDINKKYMECNGDCSKMDDFYPMTAFDESGVVGHLIMRFTDEEKQVLRFGFVIVDDAKRGKGYGKQMLLLAVKYAFDILKAAKVTLGVFENNEAAYHCYKAAGFKEAALEKEKHYSILGQKWKCIEMEIDAICLWKNERLYGNIYGQR